MYVLNEYMEFGVDTPYIATYNFKLVFHLLFSTTYSTTRTRKQRRRYSHVWVTWRNRLNKTRSPFASESVNGICIDSSAACPAMNLNTFNTHQTCLYRHLGHLTVITIIIRVAYIQMCRESCLQSYYPKDAKHLPVRVRLPRLHRGNMVFRFIYPPIYYWEHTKKCQLCRLYPATDKSYLGDDKTLKQLKVIPIIPPLRHVFTFKTILIN